MADSVFNTGSTTAEAISYTFRPSFQRLFNSSSVIVEVIGKPRPDSRHAQVIGEALSRAPTLAVSGPIMEVIGSSPNILMPLFADSAVATAVQHDNSWPTLSDTISPEGVRSVWQFSAVSMPIDPPISYSRVASSVTMAVLSRPITTISDETVKSFWSFAAHPAALGDYPLLDQVRSPVEAPGAVLLVAQSMEIPYVPSSGVFSKSSVSLVVSSLPLPMYTTPVSVRLNGALVAQKRPLERLPRSYTSVRQSLSQAVTAKEESLPLSPSKVLEVLTQAVSLSDFSDPPVGPVEVGSELALVALPSHDNTPVSTSSAAAVVMATAEEDRSLFSMPESRVSASSLCVGFVSRSDLDWGRSSEFSSGIFTSAVQAAKYASPGELLAACTAASARELVTSLSNYPDPAVPVSPAYAASVVRAATTGAVYPDPDKVYAESKFEMVRAFRPLVSQKLISPWPISENPVPSFVELVAADLPMPDPETVAESGIKASMVSLPVAVVADYPSKDAPASTIQADQVVQALALIATYPDPHAPTSDIRTSQLMESVSEQAEYPDPAGLNRPVSVNSVLETSAFSSEFPQWDTVHRPVFVSLVSQQTATKSAYPDKSEVLSFAQTRSVVENVASRAVYPDKNKAMSKAISSQVVEHIAVKDKSLYSLPEPPRKHRVQITLRYVY